MATKLPLRIGAPLRPRPLTRLLVPQQRRTFLSELGKALGAADPSKPASIKVSRTLPHSSWDLYTLIADVDSYRDFVPFCTSSHVTQWTDPDGEGRKWPSQADLTVGAFGFSQTYTSRLHCVPGVSVEALSGADAFPESEKDSLRKTAGGNASVFRTLITKWTVTPVGKTAPGSGDRNWTAVDLSILFHFANPAHQIAMASMSEEQARRMIAAFEQRAKEMFGRKQR